jgi:spire-like protein
MIERLISADECGRDSCDEGIERDSDDISLESQGGLTVDKVVELCSGHLAHPEQADAHYKAVCRALVAEGQELSTFLSQISSGTKGLKLRGETETAMEELRVCDWARIWMQVIRELRNGVKLKKVDYQASLWHPIEFELTPYEMLLDDIRSQRYKLNKVSLAVGSLPNRVKDAHDLVLEFIRSRPPLVPASKRQLRPATVVYTPHDKLMEEIKCQHSLKPTPSSADNKPPPQWLGRVTDSDALNSVRNCDRSLPASPRRRLIKADLNLNLPNVFSDKNEEFEFDTPCEERSRPKSVCEQVGAYNYLSLTLQEVQHIRSVITKAELESLSSGMSKVDREDLENGKICFTCLKQRFSLFGPWPVKCKLCERSICDKCSTAMHVPTECFSKVPIFMLSPSSPTPGNGQESECSSWDGQLGGQPNGKQRKMKKSGLLMKLCRDCLLLARNIKEGNEGRSRQQLQEIRRSHEAVS